MQSNYLKSFWNNLNKETKKSFKRYLIFHDCGKLNNKIIDEHGKWHFPEHAKKSYELWKKINIFEATLMKHDMDIHILKSEQLNEFCSNPLAPYLLLSGLSEIFANAEQFGGRESISFKIKYKNINRNGKKIIAFLEK